MSWIVYILECGDGTLYTGITNNLASRVVAHESGQGAKYTRGRSPFKVIYKEALENRSKASKREGQIKALSRKEKLELLGKSNLI
ncbi:MAG: GIY-YIG nuclease family protein [Proteobacteria bacterium]|nr:GIY-YIG nuclease family protein [Pseudomonadota bacterium]